MTEDNSDDSSLNSDELDPLGKATFDRYDKPTIGHMTVGILLWSFFFLGNGSLFFYMLCVYVLFCMLTGCKPYRLPFGFDVVEKGTAQNPINVFLDGLS